MILLVNSDDGLVIGEVTSVEVFNDNGWVIVHSDNVDVYTQLLDFGNYLFYFISGDNYIKIIKHGLCEWVSDSALKVECSVIDSHYVKWGSYLGKIWSSYLRNKNLHYLLDKWG